MRFILPICLSLAAILAACSPALNWRSVALDNTPYKILLPCKPDKGTRSLPLANIQIDLQMTGCEAGGALFAVSWIDVADPLLRQAAFDEWPIAVQRKLEGLALQPLAYEPPAALRGLALRKMASSRVQQTGTEPMQVQGLWWQHGVRVYHAAAYAPQLNAAQTEPFFSGIELQ